MKEKVFRDPIFDYIYISEDIIEKFIDTLIFQRLKNIEQTSYRVLFPSARHDRFTHSLGVFHLAKLTYESIIENLNSAIDKSKTSDQDYSDAATGWLKEVEKIGGSFLVAALMHDCAHSPFSHTLEEKYNVDKKADKYILNLLNSNDRFSSDFQKVRPKAHEIVSSCIYYKEYGGISSVETPILGKISSFKVEKELVVRMITGCKYNSSRSLSAKVRNCFISLINGTAFDIDKFDYILRDTWALGFNNMTIDIRRLIKSISINKFKNKLVVTFKIQGSDIIKDLITGKNILSERVTIHHTVEYFKKRMEKAVEMLMTVLESKDRDGIRNMFSIESFYKLFEIDGNIIFLLNDGDIINMFKKYAYSESSSYPELKEVVEELLNRKPVMTPLWKYRLEYEEIFKNMSSQDKTLCSQQASNILKDRLSIDNPLVFKMKTPERFERQKEIYIEFSYNNIKSIQDVSFNKYFDRTNKGADKIFFYVFIHKKYIGEDRDIINKCKVELTNISNLYKPKV